MTGRKIFFSRLIKGWKYQYGVIKSIADWTVMLYIIIPAATIFSFIYRSWWAEIPAWIAEIPLALLLLMIYLTCWYGNIRTYVEEGDKVFLVKKFMIFWEMKKWGLAFSLVFHAAVTGFAILTLMPFLVKYYLLHWPQILGIFIFLTALKISIMAIKYQLRKIEKKFIKLAIGIIVFILFSWLSQLILFILERGQLFLIYICSIMLLFISITWTIRRLKSIGSLEHEIALGQAEKTKNIELIFMLSHEMEKPVVSKRTKPLFFRGSKRIFKKRTPVNGFIELFLKTVLRNSSYAAGLLKIISITVLVMVNVPPLWLKILIFIGILIMLYSWLSLIWDRIMRSNALMIKYNETRAYFSARKRTITALFIVLVLLLSMFILCALFISSALEMLI